MIINIDGSTTRRLFLVFAAALTGVLMSTAGAGGLRSDDTPGVAGGLRSDDTPGGAGGLRSDDTPGVAGGLRSDDTPGVAGGLRSDDTPGVAGGLRSDDTPGVAGGLRSDDTPGGAGGLRSDDRLGGTDGAGAEGGYLSSFCHNVTHDLHDKKKFIGRNGGKISKEGKKLEIVFSWSSEVERAASALLALVWRCAGYHDVRVDSRPAPHAFTQRKQSYDSDRVTVGLSARCVLDVYLTLSLEVVGPGVAPTTPRLHVRLAPSARNMINCTLAFYTSSFYSDQDKLQNCLFLTRSDKLTVYFPITKTEFNTTTYEESPDILKLIKSHNITEKNISRSELEELVLYAQHESFLFVDVELWQEVKGVTVFGGIDPPPFNMYTSIRFFDANLRRYAPSLSDGFRLFSPHISDLRAVLALNMTTDSPLKAAATWTLQRSEHLVRFVGWLQHSIKPTPHYMDVVLCVGMNKTKDYDDLLELIVKKMSPLTLDINSIGIRIQTYYVDCSSATSWSKQITESSKQIKYPRLIGTVLSGEGVYNVTGEAESLKQPLFAYSMTGARNVFPLGGTPETFVQSLQNLLNNCNVRRIGVISDESAVAYDVSEALLRLHNTGALTSRDRRLLDTSEDTITEYLNSLFNDGARFFLINGDAQFAKNIIGVAKKLQLTPESGYFWIVREWARPEDDIMDIWLYELTFEYRGGENIASSGLRDLEQDLNKHWTNETLPHHATSLANAILTLAIGFTNLTKTLPNAIDDVHSPEAYSWFLKNSSLPSLVGDLWLEKHEIKKQETFLYQWNGTLSVRVHKDETCPLTFINGPPQDGSITCYTSSNGNAFPPTCNDIMWLLISVASVILLFALIVIVIACRRALQARDRRLAEQAEKMGRARLDAFTSSLAPYFVERKELKLRYQIGTGRFGLVWFGMLRDPTGSTRPIAAKVLREGAVAEEQSEFFREARNLAVLQHEHVVRFVGVCVADGPPLLLMEYTFYGDLSQYLSNRRHLVESKESESAEAQYVSAEALTRHAHDAATALSFLVRRGFVHRDVRAANCLIDDRRNLKLADFGMAREMSGAGNEHDGEYWCRRRSLFPVLWMAPESLSRGVFTTASDIWALGVLALELITLGARPYGGRSPFSVVELVTAGGRPPLPHDVSADARELLLWCWRRAPSERPTAAAIASFLEEKPHTLRPALTSDASPSVDIEFQEEVDSGIGEPPGPSSPLTVRSLSYDGYSLKDANIMYIHS